MFVVNVRPSISYDLVKLVLISSSSHEAVIMPGFWSNALTDLSAKSNYYLCKRANKPAGKMLNQIDYTVKKYFYALRHRL